MRLLLDTNAYTEFRRGHAAVGELVRDAERLVFSAIVAGELLFGFHHGSRLRRNLRELTEFLEHPRVALAPVTFETAERFGRLSAALRRRGTPVPTNDAWIAAQALETGATLVSYDRHFERIENLPWILLER